MNDYLMELFKFTIGKGNKGLIYPLVKEEIVSKENENVIDNEEVFNKPIAMVTEEKTSNFDKRSTFILIFGLLSFLVSLPILIKYVKLCRKK